MDERVALIKKKKDEVLSESSRDTAHNPMEFMKSMMLVKQEFLELMEKMKVNVHPWIVQEEKGEGERKKDDKKTQGDV